MAAPAAAVHQRSFYAGGELDLRPRDQINSLGVQLWNRAPRATIGPHSPYTDLSVAATWHRTDRGASNADANPPGFISLYHGASMRFSTLVLTGLVIGASVSAAPEARGQNARIMLRTVYGDQTTEQGHDEIYAVVTVRHQDGRTMTKRLPAGQGDADGGQAWDVNDSGEKQDHWMLATLHQEPLRNGEVVEVDVALLESDGQNYNRYLGYVGNALATSGKPPLMAVGYAARTAAAFQAIPTNEDDVLGGVTFVLKNEGGRLRWIHSPYPANAEQFVDTWMNHQHPDKARGWVPGENPGGAPNELYVRMRNVDGGDGNYRVYFLVNLLP